MKIIEAILKSIDFSNSIAQHYDSFCHMKKLYHLVALYLMKTKRSICGNV
jgi:hypothetical protein